MYFLLDISYNEYAKVEQYRQSPIFTEITPKLLKCIRRKVRKRTKWSARLRSIVTIFGAGVNMFLQALSEKKTPSF